MKISIKLTKTVNRYQKKISVAKMIQIEKKSNPTLKNKKVSKFLKKPPMYQKINNKKSASKSRKNQKIIFRPKTPHRTWNNCQNYLMIPSKLNYRKFPANPPSSIQTNHKNSKKIRPI